MPSAETLTSQLAVLGLHAHESVHESVRVHAWVCGERSVRPVPEHGHTSLSSSLSAFVQLLVSSALLQAPELHTKLP